MRAQPNKITPRRQWQVRWPDTQPTEREKALLSVIARHGGLAVSYRAGTTSFSCRNGAPVKAATGTPFCARDFRKFLEMHWLVPDPEAPGLFPDDPYLAQRFLPVSPR